MENLQRPEIGAERISGIVEKSGVEETRYRVGNVSPGASCESDSKNADRSPSREYEVIGCFHCQEQVG